MPDFMLRYPGPEALDQPVIEMFDSADAALERVEQLAVQGVREITLWKRLDFKLRAQAKLSTRLRATKTPPAVSTDSPAATPLGPQRDAGGSVPLDQTLRKAAEPVHPLPAATPICEAHGCGEPGSHHFQFKPKSPFIDPSDPILTGHFCSLHIALSPPLLWEYHVDHVERPVEALDHVERPVKA